MTMKVFLIKVGKRVRSGNFQEQFSRAVSTDDSVERSEVYNHFQSRYEGFDVSVEDVKDVTEFVQVNPRGQSGKLGNFKIKYTEGEMGLFREYKVKLEAAQNVLESLHKEIRDRYGKLSYYKFNGYSIELETFTNHPYGTICKNFPINSDQFFKVVKAGVEDITNTEPNFDPPETDTSEVSFDDSLTPDPGPDGETLIVIPPSSTDDEYNDIPF
jgi:hypothetical protein